ncbi:MAG: regulatory protein RecX [Bacillota bacterium]
MIAEEARKTAIKYLSYRVRTVKEVQDYLRKKRYDQHVVNYVIEYLQNLAYLDDGNFCNLWIESRIRLKPMGKIRLHSELSAKGIDGNLIEKALDHKLPYDFELCLARDLVQARLSKCQDTLDKKQEKILLFLQRRGFSNKIIFKMAEEFFS